MDDDDFFNVENISMRFMRSDILPLALGLLEGIAGAIHSTTVTAYNVAARHANHKHQQDDFRRAAELDIETITEGDDG